MQHDPTWWMDRLVTVTPDDIRRAHQEALDGGVDPVEAERWLQRAIKGAGGSIEFLAEEWTTHNRKAAFRAQLSRRKPRQTPATLPVDAKSLLRELIEQFPEVARDVLAGDDLAGDDGAEPDKDPSG